MTPWLGLFICWTVLAAVDAALAVAFWPHAGCPILFAIALFAAYHALLAVHRITVERRFRRAEAMAKRHLILMEACAERANWLGYDANREQLQAAVAEMHRLAKQ